MHRPSGFLAVIALGASGCITPLAHPLRASDGPIAQVALSAGWTGGDAVSCYTRCDPSGVSGVTPSAQVTVGYAHVFARHVGLMGGITVPATESIQGGRVASVSAFAFTTLQNEHGSVGFGPEIYSTAWALAMGAEWRFLGEGTMSPAIAAYARWFLPFGSNDPLAYPHAQRALELGARVRVGPWFAQYTYVASLGIPFEVPVWIEGSYETSALHLVTLGFTLDGEFLKTVREWHAARHRRVVIGAPEVESIAQ